MHPYIVFSLAFERDMEIRRQVELKRLRHPDIDPFAQGPIQKLALSRSGWNGIRRSHLLPEGPVRPVEPDRP